MLRRRFREVYNLFKRLTCMEGGATMVEYALMFVLISIIAFGIVTLLGTSISAAFFSLDATIDKA